MRSKLSAFIAMVMSVACLLTGCQTSVPSPGDIEGYDIGEEYLSIWVHTIEDTDEGRCYKESVRKFNEAYNGKYFADIEFIPRNDSGGGYSDKINASVMSGDLPDVITVDGPNIAAYAMNNIIQPLAQLSEDERSEYLESIRMQKYPVSTVLRELKAEFLICRLKYCRVISTAFQYTLRIIRNTPQALPLIKQMRALSSTGLIPV